jgi:hypothetical protein
MGARRGRPPLNFDIEERHEGEAILIAGGYGVVGSRIAAELASDHLDRVIVAGRNLGRADATAAAIGHGVRGRELDVTVPSSIAAALDDVAVVVSCIDQPQRGLLHAVVERGLRYTDITPHLTELGRGVGYEQIDAAAKASGARLLLGAGLVPGISSVMVRAAADTIDGADTIETALLLTAGDVTGPASLDYFLQELTMSFDVHIDGTDRPARAFSDPCTVDFPAPVGPRPAYFFPRRRDARRAVESRDARGSRTGRCHRRGNGRPRAFPVGWRGCGARRVDARAGHRPVTLLRTPRAARTERRACSRLRSQPASLITALERSGIFEYVQSVATLPDYRRRRAGRVVHTDGRQ